MDELRDELARLLDERAIVATLYRYGDALDHGDLDEFLDCFTPDAEYVVQMRLDAASGFTHEGHDQWMARARTFRATSCASTRRQQGRR
jgi:ketosteroid isomerase-like protein